MIHKPTIEWLQRQLGGTATKRRSNQENARQGWSWQISGVRSWALLRRLVPFLVTKQEEAFVAIALAETLWENNIKGRVPKEVLEERRRLGDQLRQLKRLEWK